MQPGSADRGTKPEVITCGGTHADEYWMLLECMRPGSSDRGTKPQVIMPQRRRIMLKGPNAAERNKLTYERLCNETDPSRDDAVECIRGTTAGPTVQLTTSGLVSLELEQEAGWKRSVRRQ
ncbi:Hypothetical predicted protein, partial [Pelobates cultripes]